MPNDPRANVLLADFETPTAIFNKYEGDEDASLRLAVNLLASGQIQLAIAEPTFLALLSAAVPS